MASIYRIRPEIVTASPPIPDGVGVSMAYGPNTLRKQGVKFHIVVSHAKSLIEKQKNIPNKSISVMGLLDTGANPTSIDISIADYLGLPIVNSAPIHTASGTIESKHFTVSISFVGCALRQFPNLKVSSCKLKFFDLEKTLTADPNKKNIGVLIGRDIMAHWNIVWHGPTSTVFISD